MTSSIEAPPAAQATPQVAVNDIGSAEDFLAAIDATIKYFNDGDIVDGTIVKVDRDEVLLDIGYKTEGVIPSRELSIKHDVDPGEVVAVGDKVEALVLQKEDKEGRLILSKKRAQYERAWGTIEKIKEEDGVVTGSVIEVVKGGLIIDIGLRGFLPASLVEMRRVRDLQPYVGKELEAKIIELDKNRNNVVLSRRAWLEQTQSEVRQNFLTQLQKGQVRPGVVSSIVNFGAFVDLGGVDGLVHVSELSWKHIDHPSEVVEVGQEVTVEVLDVDMDRERVSLSLKATQEDPWQQFARTHQMGQIVPGKVTKLVPFGAFVRVDEGIEGLVHISELAERHVEIPEQVVQVNDDVMVKIIDIDLERRRISLSLKQANEGVDHTSDEFDPTLYGMAASYDDAGQLPLPRRLRPGDGRVARGLRGAEGRLGAAVRRGARPLGGPQARRSRRPPRPTSRPARRPATAPTRPAPRPPARHRRRAGIAERRRRRIAGVRRGAAGAAREAHRRSVTAPAHAIDERPRSPSCVAVLVVGPPRWRHVASPVLAASLVALLAATGVHRRRDAGILDVEAAAGRARTRGSSRWGTATSRARVPMGREHAGPIRRTDALGPDAYFDDAGQESEPGCHRASRTVVVPRVGDLHGANLACSGATTRSDSSGVRFKPGLDFFDETDGDGIGQALALQQVRGEPPSRGGGGVSIGGNDFGFGALAGRCVQGNLSYDGGAAGAAAVTTRTWSTGSARVDRPGSRTPCALRWVE